MVEPNRRATFIGTSADLTPEGNVKATVQVAKPTVGENAEKGGASTAQFMTVTGVGTNYSDAIQSVQEQLPRHAYSGHRQAGFVSDKLARRGLMTLMDTFSRNPLINTRGELFVVEGGSPEDFLRSQSSTEEFTTTAALRGALVGDMRPPHMRQLEIDWLSDGARPVIPVIDLALKSEGNQGESPARPVFRLHRIALLNKRLQLKGILADDDALDALWVAGKLKRARITEYSSVGGGYLTLNLNHTKRRVRSMVWGDSMKVFVTLSASATVIENNGHIDLSKPESVRAINRELNATLQQQVQDVVHEVQTKYGQDMFGFGEDIHRRHPTEWKHLKRDWDRRFQTIECSVKSDVSIRTVGYKGPGYRLPSR